jgi:hypothetical protein
MSWRISGCDGYLKRVKEFGKKYPHELRAVAQNLRTLMDALDLGTKPEQLKLLGFVHGNYDLGILSLDETGHDKPSKPKALRLYLYPCIENAGRLRDALGTKRWPADRCQTLQALCPKQDQGAESGSSSDATHQATTLEQP